MNTGLLSHQESQANALVFPALSKPTRRHRFSFRCLNESHALEMHEPIRLRVTDDNDIALLKQTKIVPISGWFQISCKFFRSCTTSYDTTNRGSRNSDEAIICRRLESIPLPLEMWSVKERFLRWVTFFYRYKQVLIARMKDTSIFYAVKVLSKAFIRKVGEPIPILIL